MNSRHLYLTVLLGSVLVSCSPSPVVSPTTPVPLPTVQFNASDEDLEAIQQTALDYIEGWYEGNVERMERSLHPDLVKRVIRMNRVDTLSAEEMVNYTRQGGGKAFTGQKKNTVIILDVYNDIATVKAESAEYIDYLHIGKVNGRWVIINVLWTSNRPE
jgi:hypothetical protein